MCQSAFAIRQLASLMALFTAAVCISTTVSTPAVAQRTGTPVQAVSTFLGNPPDLLTKSPNGGGEMVSSVRDLVAADSATLQPILNLLANANKDQKSAIGAGLAQAAKIVVRTNPAFATEIQQAILNTKDQDVVLAFAAGSGDVATAAAGGGGGAGGGGASGGQTNPLSSFAGGTGGAQTIGQAGSPTPNFSYSSSVVGLGSTNTALNGTNIAAPVSP